MSLEARLDDASISAPLSSRDRPSATLASARALPPVSDACGHGANEIDDADFLPCTD